MGSQLSVATPPVRAVSSLASRSTSRASLADGSVSVASASVVLSASPQASSLDVSYITPRVIACGRPSVRESDLDDHRNNIDDLASFLDSRHPESYMLINLSNKTRAQIDYSRFHNAIVEFHPHSRADLTDDTPGLGEVFRACYCLRFALEWRPDLVAVMHCNSGVFRTGFILAAFLVYVGQCASMGEALALFSRRRVQGHINTNVAAYMGVADDSSVSSDERDRGAGGGAQARGTRTSSSLPLGVDAAGAGAGADTSAGSSIAARMLPSWRYLAAHLDAAMCATAPSLPRALRLAYVIIAAPGLERPADALDHYAYPVVQLLEVGAVLLRLLPSAHSHPYRSRHYAAPLSSCARAGRKSSL
jgi:hypothetical protein